MKESKQTLNECKSSALLTSHLSSGLSFRPKRAPKGATRKRRRLLEHLLFGNQAPFADLLGDTILPSLNLSVNFEKDAIFISVTTGFCVKLRSLSKWVFDCGGFRLFLTMKYLMCCQNCGLYINLYIVYGERCNLFRLSSNFCRI